MWVEEIRCKEKTDLGVSHFELLQCTEEAKLTNQSTFKIKGLDVFLKPRIPYFECGILD